MDGLVTETEIAILPNREAVAKATADLIVESCEEATGREFRIVLAGGDTPRPLYETLGQEPYASRIAWGRWCVWWGDERAVPPDAPDSNYAVANAALLSGVPIPRKHVHRIHVETGTTAAVTAYESEIRGHFGDQMPQFDLILLGIGEDGHTASLFPGTQALGEARHPVAHGFAPRPPHDRVTLTLPAINAARRIIFIVTGRNKAHGLRNVVAADQEDAQRPPASLVRPVSGTMHFMVDQEAALLLTGNPVR